MISRHWKGVVKNEKTNDYINHLKNDTFQLMTNIKGFISAQILHRDIGKGVEFLIITEWATIDAIKEFAGPGYENAVVPPVAQSMMLEYDKKVLHYEVNFKTGLN